jgi:hypothetical protein
MTPSKISHAATRVSQTITVNGLIFDMGRARNMVAAQNILTDLRAHFLNRYATEVRFPNQAEPYTAWVKEANAHFASEYTEARQRVVAAIPERLHKTIMYQQTINHGAK